MSAALILFGHGSRDPRWADPMRRIQALIEARPGAPRVRLAYLEFMAPDLPAAVAAAVADGATSVRVAPLFLGQGGHLRNDLTAIVGVVRKANPALAVEVLGPMGEADEVLRGIADWAFGQAS